MKNKLIYNNNYAIFKISCGGKMKAKIIYFLLVLILSLFIIDLPSFILLFIPSDNFIMPENHWQNILIPFLAVYFLIITLGSFLNRKKYKLVIAVLLILTVPLNIIIAGMYIFDDYFMTYNIVTNIFIEQESILSIIFDFKTILLMIFLFIPFIILWKIKPVKITNKYISYGIMFLSILMIIITFSKSCINDNTPLFHKVKTYIKVSNDKKSYNEVKNRYNSEHGKIDTSSIKSINENSIQQVYVLAIGGCQSRNHFSLYGYPRNTNPLLNELSDKLFLFKNVYAANEDKFKSVSHMITFDYDNGSYKLINIIDLFKNAGFKTYWLSNHYIYEEGNIYNNIAGINADEYLFMNNRYNNYSRLSKDEALISYYEKILGSNEHKKFIVMHLSGSCGSYEESFNEDYNYFYNKFADEKESIVNNYDNTIVQADYILNRIIEGLEINDSISYMLYVPDTGADILNKHSEYEIPFILWLSEEYKKSYPEIPEAANRNIYKYYKADTLMESISTLSQIKNNRDESRSIFSKKYNESDENVYKKN